jgi:hypothetical protein
MVKKITISIAIALCAMLIFQAADKFAFSSDGGAPSGYANDPASGSANCTGCHGGTAATVTGWITSNIPVTGYVPSTSYTITVTSTGTGGKKGFQVSPQSSTGAFLGTLVAGTGTGLTGSSHYIRSTGSNITTNPKTWTFSWTAPATGLGPVGFYGAFAIGTGTTKITSYIVTESTVGIAESGIKAAFSMFPNPAVDHVNISYTLTDNATVAINIYSTAGKKIAEMQSKEQSAGSFSENINIKDFVAKGIYIVELKIGDRSTLQKLIVN